MKAAVLALALVCATPAAAGMMVYPQDVDEAAECPGGAFCGIAALAEMAEATDTAPAACDVLDDVAQSLDLRSFPNSTGPRIDRDAVTVPADLFAPYNLPLCRGVVFQDAGWRMAFVPLGSGDWTGDGVADILVAFHDQSLDATYDAGELLVLTREDPAKPLEALRACEVLGEECGG